MRRYITLLAMLTIVATASFFLLASSNVGVVAASGSRIIVPHSNIERPEDIGVRAHTNFLIYSSGDSPNASAPPPGANTPGSVACIYRLVKQTAGCPIATSTTIPTGGVAAIALVDAFDNPNAVQDLQTFASQFGYPAPNFQVVFANGHRPANDPGGWSLEEALDIEMAFAMAPQAKIFLVEADDNSFTNLLIAEDKAAQLVVQNGGGTISNSWSAFEFQGEQQMDSHFKVPGVIYFASTGDAGDVVGYPAVSPFVTAVGGTSINRTGAGKFSSETYWTGGGGGISVVEKRPAYQNVIKNIVGNFRGTPDISAVANPNTGVAMYDADGGFGWLQIGGTSVSSPLMAGIVDAAGKLRKSTAAELTAVYKEYANPTQYQQWYRDVKIGTNNCKVGWDICTGVGAPLSYQGK